MKPFQSIRWRLQLWYGLLIAGLLLTCGIIGYNHERAVQFERIDEELEKLAFTFNTANRLPPPSRAAPPPDGSAQPGSVQELLTPALAERGFYYALWTRNREPFTASANAPAKLPQPTERQGLRWQGTRREAFVASNPGDFTLVGRDVAADLVMVRRFGWKLAGAGLAAFVVTLAIGSLLTARALRPIREISDAAQTIATGDLSRRINTKDTDSELGELAQILNSTFSRLDAAFAQQARFTADAAHELRTPVTVILTHVQNALATENLSDEQRAALEASQRAAQRMRRLLESLLRLARIDAGQEGREQAPLDVAEIASECVELVQPLAASRRITVQSELTPALARGDRDGLGQIITNLLANAVHHNHEEGEIRVSTRTAAKQVVLEIADNGPGIAPEHLPHVFKRFYRVDKARTTQQGRTGLGLAIVKAIVEAHGGEIEAQSQAGSGATFIVRLPAAG